MIDPNDLPADELEELFKLLEARAPGLIPSCRWLLFGPKLAEIALGEHAEPPSLAVLVKIGRRIRSYAPQLLPLACELMANSPLGKEALVEIHLDRLEERSDWQHPTQVLDRPRPGYRKLCEAARARLRTAPVDRKGVLEDVVAKLERAARIDESAREKRRRMRRKKQRREAAPETRR